MANPQFVKFPWITTVTLTHKERACQRATACGRLFRIEHTALSWFGHFGGNSEPIEHMITAHRGQSVTAITTYGNLPKMEHAS
jgi:hypothetical protein